ncbi:hypothetical protein EDB82DRAFT_479208 [Fusarium venenatum]|uniref:uncharacterized protein n=1 Tax=Fusarium venenatum TaxID=56646 RepID=UPI001D639462|nr:hypothetical protein EDB82DRAFT_479208 [Fusarium venenatum]
MRATLQLGFQYIWIKQLYIDQEDKEDMRCQLVQMNIICMKCAEELIQDLAYCNRKSPIFESMVDEDFDSSCYVPWSSGFMGDLEAYSKRELTYESYVLRALDGIFGFYAQLKPSVAQYWGLPLRWVGCRLSPWNPSTAELGPYDIARSKHDDIERVSNVAVVWLKSGVTCRYLNNMKYVEDSFTAPLFVETKQGGLVEPNEEFAPLLASGQPYEALGFTCIFRITTHVFDVSFIECRPYRIMDNRGESALFPVSSKTRHWVTKGKGEFPNEDSWTHFVVQTNIGAPDRGLVWYLNLTHVEATSSSNLAFDTDTFNRLG